MGCSQRLLLLLLCTAAVSTAIAQVPREVRAVWITTVASLDFPLPIGDSLTQEAELRRIISELALAGFNTVFFQVRGRADATYASMHEPWAQQLTGELGKHPGWDPLQVAIDQAHAHRMEIHAWFNTFLIKSGPLLPTESSPRHLILSHPEWLYLTGGEWWLDPGIPEAREYTLNVALDLSTRYDLDGIQFDFMRYPQKQVFDDSSYARSGDTLTRADWRRENIFKFISAFYDSMEHRKPLFKVGSTPTGVYRNIPPIVGLQGFSELYQDSRRWLREAKHDYIVPQIYWEIGHPRTDFRTLVEDWARNSYGRHVYAGLAVYKPEVKVQIEPMIKLTRAVGGQGFSFFRYRHAQELIAGGFFFPTATLIPPMPWKDSIPPFPPVNLSSISSDSGSLLLQWQTPDTARDGDAPYSYVIYRSTNGHSHFSDSSRILAVVDALQKSFVDTPATHAPEKFSYAVTSLDRGNNESAPSNVVTFHSVSHFAKPEVRLVTADSGRLSFEYVLKRNEKVSLDLRDAEGRKILSIVDARQGPGKFSVTADVRDLKEGTYEYRFHAGSGETRAPIKISR